MIRGVFRKYRTLIFPTETNQAREVSIIVDVEGTLCACVNFFLLIESVIHLQSVDDCLSVVNACRIVSYCKMTEQLEQRYCIKFCQKLGDTQVETVQKIQQAFRDDAMSIT
jgi:hypothetical protein